MNEWPLVGRDAVMQRLETLLAAGESAGGVMLAGSPGVGKSRVGQECLALAARAGYVSMRVTAIEAAASIPFGAFAPLLPSFSATVDRAERHQEMLQGAAAAIVEAGGRRPVALLIDDAHLLDAASAALAYQLALMPSVFVVLAVALGEPAPDGVTALWKDGVVERLDLGPLDPDTIGELLVDVLGAVETGTFDYLQSRSSGNVVFLRHLVLAALQSGALREDEGVWRIVRPPDVPATLAELVESRLMDLDDVERTILDTVAFGEPVGVELLARMASRTVLEALERRRLVVVERRGRRLEARLAHPLHGDVLRSRAPILRADSVRQALAAAVEESGARRSDDLLRAAAWRLQSGGPLSSSIAVRAAGRAWMVGDLGLAESLAQRAVEVGGGFEAGLMHSDILSRLGRIRDAEKELTTLEEVAADRAQLAALALSRLRIVGFHQSRLGEAVKMCERVQATVTGDRMDEVLAVHANLVMSMGDASTAVRMAAPLVTRAQAGALVDAYEAASTGWTRLGRFSAALEASTRAEAFDETLERAPGWHPAAHVLSQCEALCGQGRALEAERRAMKHHGRLKPEGPPATRAAAAFVLGRVYLAQGRAGSALRWTGEHLSLQRQLGCLPLTRWGLFDRAHALGLAGRATEAAAVIEEADSLDLPGDRRWWPHELLARSVAAIAGGNVTEALRVLQVMACAGADSGEVVPESEALHALARLGEAATVADRLATLAGQIEGDLAAARAAHARALAAHDGRALLALAESFEQFGAFLLATEAANSAAVAYRRASITREAASAVQRTVALARLCEGAVTPGIFTHQAGISLTAREREIATLAANGLSNRAIAARLSLSVRTVENQLQRVYQKLGVRGRSCLTAILHTE